MELDAMIKTLAKSPATWCLICLFIVGVDYLSGPQVQFPIFYLIPISLAAWYGGFRWGAPLAVFCGLARIGLYSAWHLHEASAVSAINAGARVVTFLVMAYLIALVSAQMREIKVLRGFLPICSNCKKIRGSDEQWHQMEDYISSHSEAKFSHGICPECYKIYQAEIQKLQKGPG